MAQTKTTTAGPGVRSVLSQRYRVNEEKPFHLADYDPGDTAGLPLDKAQGKALLKIAKKRLFELQELLYANGTTSMLIVLQGMDAAGKDGTIKHVMSGVNPQGVSVTSFKQPGPQELLHGFLWRIHSAAPAAGRIVIFNRSQYEDVLVTRVHPELLEQEHLPEDTGTPAFWKGRFEDIRHFEHYLSRQGTLILKFFLHISKEEQRARLLARLDDHDKRWKFSGADVREREFWDHYQQAYEEAVSHTSRPYAPWFVVPANHKWFARLTVLETIISALEKLAQKPPVMDPAFSKSLDTYRAKLGEETDPKD
ncbi:polyphosphate kinase 2 family protein [Acetobacter fallax]|uniref:Polyphosphate kinase 2 family protein n=1 Tax=Acetobacter fallax TaxID=1737473 RepID=A0ABX0K8E7_9PROT|nr:polyphosphate kinase 2 family protein [Acetobacter fallax]NHO31473.1 polyphosphate kinase 2 family protein [Acetobacter fallax]NHO34943.1 polyphosphate kinase 2 family protein [Acetobacter fallax]